MKRKAFTITELIIVLAVATIIVASIATTLVTLQNQTASRSVEYAIDDEIDICQSYITSWFMGYDSSSYGAPTINDNKLEMGGESCYLENSVLYYGENSKETTYITQLNFSISSNLVKCTFCYESGEYSFALVKRSINSNG